MRSAPHGPQADMRRLLAPTRRRPRPARGPRAARPGTVRSAAVARITAKRSFCLFSQARVARSQTQRRLRGRHGGLAGVQPPGPGRCRLPLAGEQQPVCLKPLVNCFGVTAQLSLEHVDRMDAGQGRMPRRGDNPTSDIHDRGGPRAGWFSRRATAFEHRSGSSRAGSARAALPPRPRERPAAQGKIHPRPRAGIPRSAVWSGTRGG